MPGVSPCHTLGRESNKVEIREEREMALKKELFYVCHQNRYVFGYRMGNQDVLIPKKRKLPENAIIQAKNGNLFASNDCWNEPDNLASKPDMVWFHIF